MTKILSGKLVSERLRGEISDTIRSYLGANHRPPCLAVVQVGDNAASSIYVNNKKKACAKVGILSREHHLAETCTTEELLALIDELNEDQDVDGILCQLPLPDHIPSDPIIDRIRPDKDVDGFHPYNVGLLQLGRDTLLPCTAAGIVEILKFYDIELEGKKVVVVGRSLIVGKPVSTLLLAENATVTVAHSRTKELKSVCRDADIVIAAIGRHHFFDRSYFKTDAVIVDVGIHHVGGKVQGDVDFASCENHVAAITPVPGGVGPMTITVLLKNTLSAYRQHEDV